MGPPGSGWSSTSTGSPHRRTAEAPWGVALSSASSHRPFQRVSQVSMLSPSGAAKRVSVQPPRATAPASITRRGGGAGGRRGRVPGDGRGAAHGVSSRRISTASASTKSPPRPARRRYTPGAGRAGSTPSSWPPSRRVLALADLVADLDLDQHHPTGHRRSHAVAAFAGAGACGMGGAAGQRGAARRRAAARAAHPAARRSAARARRLPASVRRRQAAPGRPRGPGRPTQAIAPGAAVGADFVAPFAVLQHHHAPSRVVGRHPSARAGANADRCRRPRAAAPAVPHRAGLPRRRPRGCVHRGRRADELVEMAIEDSRCRCWRR